LRQNLEGIMPPELVPADRTNDETLIRFYEADQPYGCFSNFSQHALFIDGCHWPTSEHYYQSLKMTNPQDRETVRAAAKPFLAAKLGRTRPMRADWNDVRDDAMRQALRAKFDGNADIRQILISTHGATIVEHTANDAYWGDGGDGSGRNRLGQLLMELRGVYTPPGQPKFRPPHWFRYPEIDRGDMFWRMGFGEDDANSYLAFRAALDAPSLIEHDRYYPEPEHWRTGDHAPGRQDYGNMTQ
jgi:N-glycosidase YbiA